MWVRKVWRWIERRIGVKTGAAAIYTNPTFTNLVMTTLRNHPGMVAASIEEHNSLYQHLKHEHEWSAFGDGTYRRDPDIGRVDLDSYLHRDCDGSMNASRHIHDALRYSIGVPYGISKPLANRSSD
jgi:hypothetical protein